MSVVKVFLLYFTLTGLAFSQPWPAKPVKVLIPYSAGGANDVIGRVFSMQLSKTFGQQFVVENRTGGGGLIAMEAVARSQPDGYTIFISGIPSIVLAPAMSKNKVNFDPITDFTHIAYLGGVANVVVAHPDAGINEFQALINQMKKETNPVQYLSASMGSVGNLLMQYVAEKEKSNISHIVYRGGGLAIQDLIAGHVKIGSMTITTVKPYLLTGRLLPLAVSSSQRLADFPDTPTMVELGYKDLVLMGWYSVSGPARMPREIVNRLNLAINSAINLPEIKKHLEREMVLTKSMTVEEVGDFVKEESNKWMPTARRVASDN
jgi:tripartite-type tricarboxylate transporter receptor subunit TctC